jgi:hypothetical protein
MPLAGEILFALAAAAAVRNDAAPPRAPIHHYQIASDDHGPWARVLGSIGLRPASANSCAAHPCLYVVPASANITEPQRFADLVQRGSILILEGDSAVARSFGIRAGSAKPVPARSIVDSHNPKLDIVWERPFHLPAYQLPPDALVFARERWRNLPAMAGLQHGAGAILWVAAPLGTLGYERFPYLPQALTDLGLPPPLASRDLWAFFDSSYRLRADLDYLAQRWRESGIAALHVASWHYMEPDPVRDEYLRRLVAACHRRGILVYAWVELPHVSEQFWRDHPEWREKTALLQDAHLDWRRLMNLRNPECARAVSERLARLMDRFDWDGFNLAELYFESLDGHANAARFTPMNDNVRREFRQLHGFDPAALFSGGAPDPAQLRLFLDFRAELARSLQEHWMGEFQRIRTGHPHLDLVLTHVDDRYDPPPNTPGMRDLIGADAARLLPLLQRQDFTFLVEDPATLWHLGPDRYTEMAAKYQPITPRPQKLAIDINIVSRYQDVYPTKQQTGSELFQLVHMAAAAFPRVALYFENSILAPDHALLPSSAAVVDQIERSGAKLAVRNRRTAGIPWRGPAVVNGRPWPFQDDRRVWLPAGVWSVEQGGTMPMLRLTDFTGVVRSIQSAGGGIEVAYQSDSRAFARFDGPAVVADLDGQSIQLEAKGAGSDWSLALPRGQHVFTARRK